MVAAVGRGHMPLMHPFFQKGSVASRLHSRRRLLMLLSVD
jgi:hypothetical protein